MRHSLSPLREREFRLLFGARTISFVGGAFANVALAFAVLELTGSKADLGYVLAARTVPMVVFLLVGGIWADRLPRHYVMVASNLALGREPGRDGGPALLRPREGLAAGRARGGERRERAFFFPASGGIIPQTVPESLLQQANSILRLGRNGSVIFGSALAGLVIARDQPDCGDRGRRRLVPARRAG